MRLLQHAPLHFCDCSLEGIISSISLSLSVADGINKCYFETDKKGTFENTEFHTRNFIECSNLAQV